MPSLREALTTAYDIADEGGDLTAEALRTEPEVVEPEETTQQKADRVRDEAGKFAKAPKEKIAPVQTEQPEPWKERPKSWKKDFEPHWRKLVNGQPLTPQEQVDIAKYNREREDQFTNGITTYKGIAEQAKPILDAIAPFMPALQKAGITVDQEIKMLLNAHHTLALGSPQERLRMFAQLANEYEVDLRVFGGQPVQQGQQRPDPQLAQIMTVLNQTQGRLQQFETQQQQQQREAAQSSVEHFGSDKPHFDKVRNTMADLIDKGLASSLNDAYNKAVKWDDEIQESIRTEAELQSRSAKTQQVQAAKKQAVSPKSSAPTAMTSGTRKGRAGLRDVLSEAFDAHTSGRV